MATVIISRLIFLIVPGERLRMNITKVSFITVLCTFSTLISEKPGNKYFHEGFRFTKIGLRGLF